MAAHVVHSGIVITENDVVLECFYDMRAAPYRRTTDDEGGRGVSGNRVICEKQRCAIPEIPGHSALGAAEIAEVRVVGVWSASKSGRHTVAVAVNEIVRDGC